jgi:hypothetical protein
VFFRQETKKKPSGPLRAHFNGPAKEAAEKVCTGQESKTSGAKARRILNHLRPG